MVRDTPRNPLLLQVLSLYLLLLAFFVVLNTISHVEEARLRAVTGSLTETFSAEGIPAEETIPYTSNEGNVPEDSAFIRRIGELITTELAFAEVTEPLTGRLLEVTVPQNEIFVRDRAAIAPERRPLIEDVARAVAAPFGDLRYDVEILIGAPTGDELAIARSAYLAEVFVAAGAGQRSVLAGVVREHRGDVKLRFHVRSRRAAESWQPKGDDQ